MYDLDQTQLRRACDRVAADYDDADFFCAEVRGRLFDRLDLMALDAHTILDLGGATGAAADELAVRYQDALIIELDWSEQMLMRATERSGACVCADSHKLPLADNSVDIVVSNMMLPGCADPQSIFSEVSRVLKNPGLFLFNTFGPDSLKEMRRAWSAIDARPHVHVFADMHHIGDALLRAGFSDPVMDVEMLTVTYADVNSLAKDLRAVAGGNFVADRFRGLTTPHYWGQVASQLDAGRNTAGRLPVTMEVITGQAWTSAPDPGVPLKDGEAHFPISRLKF